ncbi:MAG: hypothetical protein GXO29_04895 [Thermotogae bacterium]|nr:hypothetical protein [Thermotogota bacterium]
MRRIFGVCVVALLLVSCTEERYSERLLPGSFYLQTDTPATVALLSADGEVIFTGETRKFYKTSYYSPNRFGELKVYLPTGSGCAKAEVELDADEEGCNLAIVPDTPSIYAGCPSCDSIETRRTTIIDVLTWDRPVAVVKDKRCLQVFQSTTVSALYIDSLMPGMYVLIIGSDTDTVFVSSRRCSKILRGGEE